MIPEFDSEDYIRKLFQIQIDNLVEHRDLVLARQNQVKEELEKTMVSLAGIDFELAALREELEKRPLGRVK